jgi:integrase
MSIDQDRKAKRGQNEGTWRTLPSGSWELRFSYKDENGWSRRGSVSAPTKDEARTRRDDVLKAVKDGRRVVRAAKVPTLSAWIDSWLVDVLPHSGRAANTRKMYASLLSTHVQGTALAKHRLADLRPSQLQALVGTTTKHDGAALGHSSRRNLFAALVAVLDTALDDGLIADNPMRKAKRPKNPNPGRQAEARALTDTQVTAILRSVDDHRHGILVRVALLTGMRRGELIGLTWDAIGFDTGTLRVRQQVTGDDADPTDVKTAAGDRVIPMSDELRALLVTHGLDQQVRHARLTDPRTDLVFTDRFGQQVDPRALSRWYALRVADTGVDETGLHALRHTAISRWIAAGIPITVVARWAGHADPSITLRVYAWALPLDEADYANRVTLSESSHQTSPTRTHNVMHLDAHSDTIPSQTA